MGHSQKSLNKSHGAKLSWHKIKTNEVIDRVNSHTDEIDELKANVRKTREDTDQNTRDIKMLRAIVRRNGIDVS